MPAYDFRCGACRKRFSLVLSIGEREQKRIKCPKCGSQRVETVFSAFFAKTSRKS
jgi:putative FmdB family regulatory protein